MDAIWAAVTGGLIGGLAVVAGVLLGEYYQRKRSRETTALQAYAEFIVLSSNWGPQVFMTNHLMKGLTFLRLPKLLQETTKLTTQLFVIRICFPGKRRAAKRIRLATVRLSDEIWKIHDNLTEKGSSTFPNEILNGLVRELVDALGYKQDDEKMPLPRMFSEGEESEV